MLKVIFSSNLGPDTVRTLEEAEVILRKKLTDDSVDLFLLNAKPGATFKFQIGATVINLSVVEVH